MGDSQNTVDSSGGDSSSGGSITDTLNSPDFWRNLMMFGANMGVAANARTPQGFLQYGSGLAGPMGAGIQGAVQDARKYQQLQNQQALQRAQVANYGSENTLRGAQTELAKAQTTEAQINAVTALRRQQLAEQDLAGGNGITGNITGSTATPSSGPLSLPQAINSIEDPTYQKINNQGYVGGYQFGTQELADTGVYHAAPGEDLSKNSWKGTFTLPGQTPTDINGFLHNKQLQDQAFAMRVAYLDKQASDQGMLDHLGKTINGVPITPETITALEHFGGITGAKRFLYTNGGYDPADANNVHLSGYAGRVASLMGLTGQAGRDSQSGDTQNPNGVGSAANPVTQVANTTGAPNAASNATSNPSPVSGAASNTPSPGTAPTLPNGMTPQQALAMADALDKKADNYKFAFNTDLVGARNQATALRQMATAFSTKQAEAAAAYPYQAPIRAEAGGVIYQNGKIVQAVPRPTVELNPDLSRSTVMRDPVTGAKVGEAIPESAAPIAEEQQKEAGKGLGEDYTRINKVADTALDSNNQLNLLLSAADRNKDSWLQPGGGTQFLASVGGQLSGVMNKFGISTPQWNASLGNIQQMQSLIGAAARSAIHEAGGRSNTELGVITRSLPGADMTPAGLYLSSAPLMGANDFDLAKQQAKEKWWNEHNRSLEGFESDFNNKISPGVFTLYRLQQSPYGTAAVKALLDNMQQTAQGKATLAHLKQQMQFGMENGYFEGVDPSAFRSSGNSIQANAATPQTPQNAPILGNQ